MDILPALLPAPFPSDDAAAIKYLVLLSRVCELRQKVFFYQILSYRYGLH
jgi:hypothetical protein